MAKLAIEGGDPVRSTLLPYGRQTVDEDDVRAVSTVLQSDWLTTGPNVDEFETAFAETTGARFAVAFCNGTAALHGAAFAADINPKSAAVVPAMTFAASANCVRYLGGQVIFADVNQRTLNLDVSSAERLLSRNCRAVIAADFSGQPADIDELLELAHSRDALLIEDASHALGAEYRGRREGPLADMTTFSLHPVKLMTTGEGGMVTTNDAELATRLRAFRNHGITTTARQRETAGSWYYEMTDLGFNYRLTDIQSALGRSQLRKIHSFIARRQYIAERYTRAFREVEEIETPFVETDRTSAWHLYVIRLNLEKLRVGRKEVFQALRAENIGVNVHYIPVPWHPYYQNLGYQRGHWPVAEHEYQRVITLPLWPGMTDADVGQVIEAVNKVTAAYRKSSS